MKKLLSYLITAVITVSVTPSVFAVDTVKEINESDIKELVCLTGLSAYPETADMPISELGKIEDVLNPEEKNLNDIINTKNSYRIFNITNASEPFKENPEQAIIFTGTDENNIQTYVYYFPEDYIDPSKRNTLEYEKTITNEEYENGMRTYGGFCEEYEQIAEILNNNNIVNITEIKIVGYTDFPGMCVYIKDSSNGEFAISCNSYNLPDGKNLMETGEMMSFNEWIKRADEYISIMEENLKIYQIDQESLGYGEVRDTNTLLPYIGTESIFSDVSGDLVSYVNELSDLGIITGYSDGTFKPENTITRAEAAAMIARLFKYSGSYNNEFSDVKTDDWFADYVAALASKGIIDGYDNTTFAPNNNIKYQEIMKILVCALGYGYFQGFGSDAYPTMTNKKAMEIGLTQNLKSFDTTAPITRGDMAIMLSAALDTHMLTKVEVDFGNGTRGGTTMKDITLIDYLNGSKLNGTFIEPKFD